MRNIELRMDITNTCNLRCIMCHLPYLHQTPHMMSAVEFKRIITGILPALNTLYLSWATEPMLNPHLPEILEYTRKAEIPSVIMVSNLTHLSAGVLESISTVHRLHVSVDSANAATYAVIRQKDNLNRVSENIKKIQKVKKERGWKYPQLAINAVLLRMNLHQLEFLIDFAVSHQIDEINLSFISVPERYENSMLNQKLIGLPENFNLKTEVITPDDPEVRSVLKQVIQYAEKRGIVLTVPGRFFITGENSLKGKYDKIKYMLRKGMKFPPRALWHLTISYVANFLTMRKAYCTFPFRQMVLTSDGVVLPCCVWDDHDGLGDIRSSTLEDIWGSNPFKTLQRAMLSNDIPPICASCTRVNSKRRHGV